MKFTANKKTGNLMLTFNSNINVDNSYNSKSIGNRISTMELFTNDNGTPVFIEWDVVGVDTEHIGIWFDGKTLVEYDGIFELPSQAIKLIRKSGYTVPKEFTM